MDPAWNVFSGCLFSRYLDLVHGKPLYACLLDSEATVVSFPPITNCDITKVGGWELLKHHLYVRSGVVHVYCFCLNLTFDLALKMKS